MTITQKLADTSEGARKIKMEGERCRYTIQAHDERFFVMTKPFNTQKTYIYTIADLERGERGACNLIFGMSFDIDEPDGAARALGMLRSGEMEVSRRNCVPLKPSEIEQLKAREVE